MMGTMSRGESVAPRPKAKCKPFIKGPTLSRCSQISSVLPPTSTAPAATLVRKNSPLSSQSHVVSGASAVAAAESSNMIAIKRWAGYLGMRRK